MQVCPNGFVAMVKDANTWNTKTIKMAEVLLQTSDSRGKNLLILCYLKN